MSTPSVPKPTKAATQVRGRAPASQPKSPVRWKAQFTVGAGADSFMVKDIGTRSIANRFGVAHPDEARQPPNGAREMLDEKARIYSEFCKSRA